MKTFIDYCKKHRKVKNIGGLIVINCDTCEMPEELCEVDTINLEYLFDNEEKILSVINNKKEVESE